MKKSLYICSVVRTRKRFYVTTTRLNVALDCISKNQFKRVLLFRLECLDYLKCYRWLRLFQEHLLPLSKSLLRIRWFQRYTQVLSYKWKPASCLDALRQAPIRMCLVFALRRLYIIIGVIIHFANPLSIISESGLQK